MFCRLGHPKVWIRPCQYTNLTELRCLFRKKVDSFEMIKRILKVRTPITRKVIHWNSNILIVIFASCQQNYINSGSLKKLDFMYEELLVCARLLGVFRGGEGSGLPLGPIASGGGPYGPL